MTGLAMDLSAFETWLGGIAALTGPQRRQAWQALALSETADSGDIGTETSLDPALRGLSGRRANLSAQGGCR